MKRSFSILLLFIYLALLYMPYIPHIYFALTDTEYSSEQIIDKSDSFFSSQNLIGDICYIRAIKKRADNHKEPIQKTKQISIVNTTNLEFITPININSRIKPNNNIFEFGEYIYLIIEKTKDIDIPPPKLPTLA